MKKLKKKKKTIIRRGQRVDAMRTDASRVRASVRRIRTRYIKSYTHTLHAHTNAYVYITYGRVCRGVRKKNSRLDSPRNGARARAKTGPRGTSSPRSKEKKKRKEKSQSTVMIYSKYSHGASYIPASRYTHTGT